MLENPSNTQQWLNDPDTGPMLIQISRIYHAEKHAPRSTSLSHLAARRSFTGTTYGATGLSAHALGVPNSPFTGGASSYSAGVSSGTIYSQSRQNSSPQASSSRGARSTAPPDRPPPSNSKSPRS